MVCAISDFPCATAGKNPLVERNIRHQGNSLNAACCSFCPRCQGEQYTQSSSDHLVVLPVALGLSGPSIASQDLRCQDAIQHLMSIGKTDTQPASILVFEFELGSFRSPTV